MHAYKLLDMSHINQLAINQSITKFHLPSRTVSSKSKQADSGNITSSDWRYFYTLDKRQIQTVGRLDIDVVSTMKHGEIVDGTGGTLRTWGHPAKMASAASCSLLYCISFCGNDHMTSTFGVLIR